MTLKMLSTKLWPFCLSLNVITLDVGDRIILVQHNKYHGCSCPGLSRHQDISTHDIDYAEYVSSCITWGRISTTCVMSVWRNDRTCIYIFMFPLNNSTCNGLTHWGWETHICVSEHVDIGSDYGLVPNRHQAIILTNAGILLIGPLRTNFNELLIEIHTFSFKKMHVKMSSGKWRPFCLSLNELKISESRTPVQKPAVSPQLYAWMGRQIRLTCCTPDLQRGAKTMLAISMWLKKKKRTDAWDSNLLIIVQPTPKFYMIQSAEMRRNSYALISNRCIFLQWSIDILY